MSKTIATFTSLSAPSFSVTTTTNKPASNWYAKRANAHFATYFGAEAYGVNG